MVDAVLEHAAGEVVAVEMKSVKTVRSADFRTGGQALRLANRLRAGLPPPRCAPG